MSLDFKEIPLIGGVENSHQTFGAQLGAKYVEFELNFIWTAKQWSINIHYNDKPCALGLILLPNVNLLETSEANLDLGFLAFFGEEPTLDNLGINNHLIWAAPS